MVAVLEEENKKIYQLGQTDEYKGMGTTLKQLLSSINR